MVADRPRGKGKRTAKFKSNFDVEGGKEGGHRKSRD